MYRLLSWVSISLVAALSFSCEKEFDPETTFTAPELVVEGYVTIGDDALPPYVILTKTVEYNSDFGFNDLGALFVKGADVRITDGTDTVQLVELCASALNNLPQALRDAALQAIGLPNWDYSTNDLCIYVDLLSPLNLGLDIREGGRYELLINTKEFGTTTAVTTIPQQVTIDSISFENHPTYPKNDSLVEVTIYFEDPIGPNYYRIFTRRNNEGFFPASTKGTNGSVTDDRIFEGREFSFAVVRGQDPNVRPNATTFGYFWRGDNVTCRGCNIDYEHFRFWQTREYGSTSQGPFGSYTRIQSNINNGLGIWGGYACRNASISIPE